MPYADISPTCSPHFLLDHNFWFDWPWRVENCILGEPWAPGKWVKGQGRLMIIESLHDFPFLLIHLPGSRLTQISTLQDHSKPKTASLLPWLLFKSHVKGRSGRAWSSDCLPVGCTALFSGE